MAKDKQHAEKEIIILDRPSDFLRETKSNLYWEALRQAKISKLRSKHTPIIFTS
jgi:hypothetical protein